MEIQKFQFHNTRSAGNKLSTTADKQKPIDTSDQFIQQSSGEENSLQLLKNLKNSVLSETSSFQNQSLNEAIAFQVQGGKKHGFYKNITGQYEGKDVTLEMSRKSNYVDGGGFLVEVEPSFDIRGDFAELPLDLHVEQQIITAELLPVQIGTVYHVTGKLGDRNIKADITHNSETLENLPVETAVNSRVKGQNSPHPDLELKKVENIIDVGGILVEGDSYELISGEDAGGKVEAKITGLNRGSIITVEGTVPKDTLAMVLGLKPFLYVC